MQVKEGQLIRLKKNRINGAWKCPEGRVDNQTAMVHTILSGEGFLKQPGKRGIYTDVDLRGCRYWNEEDVTKA